MTISEAAREYLDDIDDQTIKAELWQAISALDMIHAGLRDQSSEEFLKAFNRSVEGYNNALQNQRASISRLLNERTNHLLEIAQLKGEVEAYRRTADQHLIVGPE